MNIGTKVALAVAGAALCVATAVGLLVHRITAENQLATARSDFDRQLVSAAYDYAAGRKSPARLDPPDLPAAVSAAVRRGVLVTYLQGGPRPVLWAATRVSDHTVLALSRSYDREAGELVSLDRTLITTGTAAAVTVSLAGLATNLVVNALRHGEPPVVVEVDEDDEGPVARVRDHGPGFPPDLMTVLAFSGPQRFRTASDSTGTGLGLTIAAGQDRLLGARLTFRNHPDGGAEATLRLRACVTSPAGRAASGTHSPRGGTPSRVAETPT